VREFEEYRELLKNKYESQELYCFIIGEELLEKCQNFVNNEREMNKNQVKLFIFCIFG
jgi:hypothetical protein